MEALLSCGDDHGIKNFTEFHFNPKNVPYKHLPCYVIKMITDLPFSQHWRIKMPTLARYIENVGVTRALPLLTVVFKLSIKENNISQVCTICQERLPRCTLPQLDTRVLRDALRISADKKYTACRGELYDAPAGSGVPCIVSVSRYRPPGN